MKLNTSQAPAGIKRFSKCFNANKGIVQWDCTRYDDCITQMKEINDRTFNLATFYD